MRRKMSPKLRAKSVPAWIVGLVVIAVFFVVFVVFMFRYAGLMRSFEQSQRTWVTDSNDFWVEGTCSVEAGSKTNFRLVRTGQDAQVRKSRLVQGIELGSTNKAYSLTETVDSGKWKFEFTSDGPQVDSNPGVIPSVETVFDCGSDNVQTNVITDRSMPWYVSALMFIVSLLIAMIWSNFMDVKLE